VTWGGELQVTEADVATMVSSATGIPVAKLQASDRQKLLELEQRMSARVVGQPDAVKAISEAIQRARAGLSNPDRPTASFMFLGPTGESTGRWQFGVSGLGAFGGEGGGACFTHITAPSTPYTKMLNPDPEARNPKLHTANGKCRRGEDAACEGAVRRTLR
jgi:hypothetical protein